MNRTRLLIIVGVVLAILAGAWLYLDQVVLPRTMEGLTKALPALVDGALAQAGRLTTPLQVPSGSRILLDGMPIGEVTLTFRIKQDTSGRQLAGTESRMTGLLGILESPDSCMVFAGRLSDHQARAVLRADTAFVALLLKSDRPGAPITVRIVRRSGSYSATPTAYLWLPADSLLFPMLRGGGA